jgi:hypothetical protein
MDIFNRIHEKAKQAAQNIHFDLQYIPGLDEDLDTYCAFHEAMSIFCYGPTKEAAMQAARTEAAARIVDDDELMTLLIKNPLPKS